MSNVYQPKRKELAKIQVVSTETYKNNRSKYRFVGSVSRSHTNFVTTKRNTKTGRATFIEDTSALTKRSRNEIVQFFSDRGNNRKHLAYLVLPRSTKKIKNEG